MTFENRAAHIIELCKELLDDIELSRINSEALLLKATRLARLSGSDDIRQWLRYEMSGYHRSMDSSRIKYLDQTNRWIDKKEGKAIWGSLAAIESLIEGLKLKLSTMKVDSLSGDKAYIVTVEIATKSTEVVGTISQLSSIKSSVNALIHDFVSSIYYEKIFSNVSESIFADI